MKKFRSEGKGCRNLDTALHYNNVDMMAAEETRKPQNRRSSPPARLKGRFFFELRFPIGV